MTARKTKKRRTKRAPINGARALMASRKERKDSRDFFPTPPFATRALVERVFPHMGVDTLFEWASIWEPACGEGHMSEVLVEYVRRAAVLYSSDIFDYGYGRSPIDFLGSTYSGAIDWIITNPPYAKAEQFTLRALQLARVGVAMFVRVQFLESVGRYERLFRPHPPTLIAHFSERVPIVKGRWDPKKGTATAYCWLVWIKGREPLPPFWIPPGCRESLSRPNDRERFAAWSLPAIAEAAE